MLAVSRPKSHWNVFSWRSIYVLMYTVFQDCTELAWSLARTILYVHTVIKIMQYYAEILIPKISCELAQNRIKLFLKKHPYFHPNLHKAYSTLEFYTSKVQPIGCARFWRIMKNSLHSEGTCKWVNWAPIFFWYELLTTTSGPQKFAKIGVVKVDYFDFPHEIFEKLVWITVFPHIVSSLE